ncbi:hypothetical protein QEN19_002342 [Hanseniaspora menglaensis]
MSMNNTKTNDAIASPDIQIFRQVDMSKLGTPEFHIPPEVSSKLNEKYLKVIKEKHQLLLKENGYLNNANTQIPATNLSNTDVQPGPHEQRKMTIEEVQKQVIQIENFFKTMQPQQLASINRLYDVFTSLSIEEKKLKYQSMQPAQQQIITMVGKLREFYKYKEKWKQQKMQQQQVQNNQSIQSPLSSVPQPMHQGTTQKNQAMFSNSNSPVVETQLRNNSQNSITNTNNSNNNQETINSRGLLNALQNQDAKINHPYTPLLAVYNGNPINNGNIPNSATSSVPNMRNGSNGMLNSKQNTPVMPMYAQNPVKVDVQNFQQQQNMNSMMPAQPIIKLPNPQNDIMFSEEDKKFILSKIPKLPDIPEFQVVYVDPPITGQPDSFHWSKKLAKERPDLVNRIPIEILLYEQTNFKDREFLKKTTDGTASQFELKSSHGFTMKEVEEKLSKELDYYATAFKKRQMESKVKQAAGVKTKKIKVPEWAWSKKNLSFYSTKQEINKFSKCDKVEVLKIPIRLDFQEFEDGFELKDCFLINGNDQFNNIEHFVTELITDFNYENFNQVIYKVTSSILTQILAFQDPCIFNSSLQSKDLRVAVSLNIVHGNLSLKDTFEWDISNKLNDPRMFAEQMCEELELTAEFVNDVEFSIHEQVQNYLKLLVLQGNDIFLQGFVTNDDLRKMFLPNMEDIKEEDYELLFRNFTELKAYTTSLNPVTMYGIEDLMSVDIKNEEDMKNTVSQILTNKGYDYNTEKNGIDGSSFALLKNLKDNTVLTSGTIQGTVDESNDLDSLVSGRRTHEKVNYYEGFKADFDVSGEDNSVSINKERKNNLELDGNNLQNISEVVQYLQSDNRMLKLEQMPIKDIPKLLSQSWNSKFGVRPKDENDLFHNLSSKELSEMMLKEVKTVIFNQGKLVYNSQYYSNKFIDGVKTRTNYKRTYKISKIIKYGPQRCFVLPNAYNISFGNSNINNTEGISATDAGKLLIKFKFLKNKNVNVLKQLIAQQEIEKGVGLAD